VPSHHRKRVVDRELIRGGHYGQRSSEPHLKAEHMAAPTKPTDIGNATWFRARNNLFSPPTSGTGHIAIGYPNDLPNRTSTGILKKTDRY
jgi:hypothetical protein